MPPWGLLSATWNLSSTLKEYRTEQEIYTKEQAEAVATENFNIYLSHLAEKNIQILEKKCYYRYGR